MSIKLILLDRDGVINHDSDDYIKSEDEWIPIQGSIEAITLLSQAGFIVCVVTNQSGLGRGLFNEFALARMHELLCTLVEEEGGKVDAIFYCPHKPDDNCDCRKPKPGLLNQIEAQFSQSVEGSWFIGDTEKDIDAALTKNCKPILVLTGKGKQASESMDAQKLSGISVFDDLLSAAHFISSEHNTD